MHLKLLTRSLLLIGTLLNAVVVFGANCNKAPVLTTTPTATVTSPTSVTISWTTDCETDASVYWGTDTGFGNDSGIFDALGTTSHSMNIKALWPLFTYKFAVRSSAIKNGSRIPSATTFYLAGTVSMPSPDPAGPFDYFVDVLGPRNVVQGFEIYTLVKAGCISGIASLERGTYKVSVRNLPPNSAVHWPDDEYNGLSQGQRSSTAVNNDTVTFWSPVNTQFELRTNVGGITPPGTYTLSIVTSTRLTSHTDGPLKQIAREITVARPQQFPTATPMVYPPIPNLSTWRAWMTTYGHKWCGQTSFDYESVSFYDGQRVYFQVGDYTRDPATWNVCATNSKRAYRDGVVLPNHGAITGFSVFPEGLYLDYLRTGDSLSREAIHSLATRAAGAALTAGALPLVDPRNIRETAFLLNANRIDTKLGNDRSAQTKQLLATLLGHIDQIAVSETAVWHQPFMDALAAESLIAYYEDGHQNDVRVPVAVQALADYLWTRAWNHPDYEAGAFYYNSYHYSRGIPLGANEMKGLNLLIAPMYAWLFKKTGDPKYQIQGDQIFREAFTANPADTVGWTGKNFSQNYRWSFDYVKWRSAPLTFALTHADNPDDRRPTPR